MSYVLSFFELHITHSSSLSLEEIKFLAIVNWIFYVSDFSKLFMMAMMAFKYDLTSSRYYLNDRVLFLTPLLSYST